jgi:hypothetical protein
MYVDVMEKPEMGRIEKGLYVVFAKPEVNPEINSHKLSWVGSRH